MGAIYSKGVWFAKDVEVEDPPPPSTQGSEWGNPNGDDYMGVMQWGDPDGDSDVGSVHWGPAPIVSPL